MATPSSSATSPSPPMAYLHTPAQPQAHPAPVADVQDRDQKQKAVAKFMARAEVAMLTRRLRANLHYASYKATHNISHLALRDLEAQTQSQANSFSRTIAAKRKAAGQSHYPNVPINPGSTNAGAGNLRRGGSGAMAPPPSVSSPRPQTHNTPGAPGYSGYADGASGLRNSSYQAPSLYASILAPPATNQARTIHNPNDPPVPAPSRPTHTPKSRAPKRSPRNDPVRQSGKAKQPSKSAKTTPSSPEKRKAKAAPTDKGKKRRRRDDIEVDGESDLKAAATLTLLMHHNRPSIASGSSPRSSIDGSEPGSAYSYSQQYHQARTGAMHVAPPISAAPSTSSLAAEPRSQTPPPSTAITVQHSTPRASAPTDNEAASLMLFLATSPSPARPSNKDSKDMAAFRVLGGGPGPLRSKGRVLFPSTAATDPAPSGQEHLPSGSHHRTSSLVRGGDNSFTSSISSIGPELGGSRNDVLNQPSAARTPPPPPPQTTPAPYGSPSSLLPSAPLPVPTAPNSPAGRKELTASPKPSGVGVTGGGGYSGQDFHLQEYITASPSSPSRAQGLVPNRSNSSLRHDVGRKLFEEEQMRHKYASAAAAAMGPQRQEDRALSAGV